MCIRGKVIVRLHSFAGGCWSNHDVSMRYAASKCFGVVMWIECTATCLETHWIWLLEMSHAWGGVNLSSFVGLEYVGSCDSTPMMTRKEKIGLWFQAFEWEQTRPRSERSCARNVCVWNWNRWCIILQIFLHKCWNRSNTGTFGKNTIWNQKTELDIPEKESVKYGMSMYSGDESCRCENDVYVYDLYVILHFLQDES